MRLVPYLIDNLVGSSEPHSAKLLGRQGLPHLFVHVYRRKLLAEHFLDVAGRDELLVDWDVDIALLNEGKGTINSACAGLRERRLRPTRDSLRSENSSDWDTVDLRSALRRGS